MNKNILLGGIIVFCILYLIYINQFENLENTIIYSKYYNNNKSTPLHHVSSILSYLPKMDNKLDLQNYEFYDNIQKHILYWIGKKKAQINNKNTNLSSVSTFEQYYQYAKDGMVNILTNGSKKEEDWVIDNSKLPDNNNEPIIEKIDNDNNSDNKQTIRYSVNPLFWVICIVISIGVIYVIVIKGESAFKSMGIFSLGKKMELNQEDTELLSSIDSLKKEGGYNKIYYIGGYNPNLYSE